MKMEVVTITPTQAKNWLGNNLNNRNISKARVKNYAQQITKGEWQLNGEAIKLTEKGILLDGQHRLHAIIQADKPVASYVLTGVQSDVFKTIDTGKCRGAADILAIAGFENSVALAAAARAYNSLLEGYKSKESNSRQTLSNSEVLDFCNKTKGFSKAVGEAMAYKKFVKFVAPSYAGALYFMFSKKNASDCAQFFHEVNTGEGLKEDRPTYALRERLIKITGFDEVDKTKAKWIIVLFTIQAWNAYRTGAVIEKFYAPVTFKGYPDIL